MGINHLCTNKTMKICSLSIGLTQEDYEVSSVNLRFVMHYTKMNFFISIMCAKETGVFQIPSSTRHSTQSLKENIYKKLPIIGQYTTNTVSYRLSWIQFNLHITPGLIKNTEWPLEGIRARSKAFSLDDEIRLDGFHCRGCKIIWRTHFRFRRKTLNLKNKSPQIKDYRHTERSTSS